MTIVKGMYSKKTLLIYICVFIFLVLETYFLVVELDPQSTCERSALYWHLLHLRSEEIVFEEIVQDPWFVSRFLFPPAHYEKSC